MFRMDWFSHFKNDFLPLPVSLCLVLTWRMACRWDAALWTPRPAPAPVGSRSPTSLTASGGNPSSTAPTLTLTFHPRVRPETPPQPVTCKFTPPDIPSRHTHLQTVDSMRASLPHTFEYTLCYSLWVQCFMKLFIFSLRESEFFSEKITCLCNSHLKFYCSCFADKTSKFFISKSAAAELEVSLMCSFFILSVL